MFGKHKAIERFIVLFSVLMVCMSVLMGTIVVRKNTADALKMSNQAIYTTEVTMSRSHVTGQVIDVMVSEDKTKTMVLWKMDSMANLSADAEDYMMFLTGSTKNQGYDDLKCQPSGGIYVFGVSGYMGAYLVNGTPFESQILNLVIRGIKDYSSQTSASGEANVAEVPQGGDASFEKFDQMQIYFNPGASQAHHVEFLDADTIDVKDMYAEAVSAVEKAKVRELLAQDLQTMFEAQRKANRYEVDLTDETQGVYGATLAPLDVPEEFKNDEIVAYSKADGSELSWSDNQNGWVDENGTKYDSDNYYLDLKTDYVFDGGYDFAWQEDVEGGYLEDLCGSLSVDEYFKKQNDLLKKMQEEGKNNFSQQDLKFYYSDGSEFVSGSSTEDDPKVAKLSEGVKNLTNAWKTYYTTKLTFQTVHLKALLDAERDLDIVTNTYSDNFNENVLVNY